MARQIAKLSTLAILDSASAVYRCRLRRPCVGVLSVQLFPSGSGRAPHPGSLHSALGFRPSPDRVLTIAENVTLPSWP